MVEASPAPLIQTADHREYTNESQLLAACRRREISAFEQVFQDHSPRLKSIACQLLGNRSDAEDAVQETFLKLYRGIDSFHGQSSLGTWLCRILINACHDQQRKRQREAAPPEAESGAPLKTHLPLKVALQQALQRIHPRHRMVFLLFVVEGLTHAEIAAVVEVPEGTSKAWLFEAKKELKRMLTPHPGPETRP
ncbi:MAG: RNA polymerase sigma factor [Candidatus Solibacter sp.]